MVWRMVWRVQVVDGADLLAEMKLHGCCRGAKMVVAAVEGGSCQCGDGGRGERLGLGFLFGKEMMTSQTLIGQFSEWRIMTCVIMCLDRLISGGLPHGMI
ncbi:hypothetical protein DEO72_LG8g1577 [Vigna unguiculata]|uniref:Uncharacterized protein n=1 Tax=Vigna unguiculata TaxID=3917 RepID=A0A4D6MSF5_VIGUN|nr:hypothetical protein DEO72_LG8g1577 [Vigna unguiculata]